MNVFSRSIELAKISLNIIRKDKELLAFPLLGGIFSIIFMVAMAIPTIIPAILSDMGFKAFTPVEYVMIFIGYLGLAFIATFFNVCVVFTTKYRLEGKNATFMQSIKFALSKVHLIFMWSLVAATVGILLRALDELAEKTGGIGKVLLSILRSVLGLMWSIVTIFVVPAMVYNNLGPFAAIKRSVEVLKKTWGESLVRYYGLGLIELVFFIMGIIMTIALVFVLSMMGPVGTVVAIAVAALYFLSVILIFSVMNAVFNTALYEYADTGKIPEGYSKEMMEGAFKNKPSAQHGMI